MKDIKQTMFGWIKEQGHDIFVNILQTERCREIRFFSNSHVAMDLSCLKEKTETKIPPIKVGIRFKVVYCSEQADD